MVQTKLASGHIFDIQGFSVHDGPGCRTLVFFKGCSLECAWCSNPEGRSFLPEPLYRESKCTFDGLCIKSCPHKAISVLKIGDCDQLIFDRGICDTCTTFDCAEACCSGALNIGGYDISAEDLYLRILRDRPYWGEGGGITLTGGEPLAQPEFASNLLKRCYDGYIHTAIETCGNVPWENYEMALPFIDWIFFDLKTLNEDQFIKFTSPVAGITNDKPARPVMASSFSRIVENAGRIAKEFPGRLIFRLPVIPGFNDDVANITETAQFILSTGRNEINILPLHHLGREKYNLLGKKYGAWDFKIPGNPELQKIKDQFESQGIACYNGSETPF